MTPSDYHFHQLESRQALVKSAAAQIAGIIGEAVAQRGAAVIMVSGGSSPRPVYEHLSQQDLPWDKVTIGLVDERWVEETDAGSNARFIRETLLNGKASDTRFIPMTATDIGLKKGVEKVNARMAECAYPFDLCIMGMGLDGHTASWFPGSKGLSEALDIHTGQLVAAINAKGCPVAGDYAERVTLTLPAVMASRNIILLLPGAKKNEVFEQSAGQSVYDRPVNALRAAGDRLHIFSDRT